MMFINLFMLNILDYVVICLIVFHNISHDVYHSISQKYCVFYLSDISQYLMKCCTPMSDISRLIFLSPPLSHCFVTALLRTAMAAGMVRRLQAALLAMPALASFSARSSLITAHSCFASWSQTSLYSCFSILTAWGTWSARGTE